jgi:hypothetical protein
MREENRVRPKDEMIRFEAWADITDVLHIQNPQNLFKMPMQHIYSEKFLRFRIENEPHKPLYALFLRTFELPRPVFVPQQMDYYGCKSWITLHEPVEIAESRPALSERTYNERVRVTRRILTEENGAQPLIQPATMGRNNG